MITQNTIVDNVSGNGRGALYFISDLHVIYAAEPTGRVTNNVIAGNTGGGLAQYMDVGYYAGWDYGPRISDNVSWNNGDPELEATSTSVGSDGNLALDPSFRDPAAGDYRLQPGSPAIDVGAALAEPALIDLHGYPRMPAISQMGRHRKGIVGPKGRYRRRASLPPWPEDEA